MTLFQIVSISGLVLVTALTFYLHRENVIGKGGAAFWIMLFSAAAIALAAPSLTVRVAKALGIGRGTDLVMYVAILASLGAFFITHARMRRIEAELTALVREIALREAERMAGQIGS